LVLAERAGEDETARAVEGAASEEQLVGQAVLRAEAQDEERERESATAIERAAEKVQEAESRNVVEEKELQAVTEREGKSLAQQHHDLEQQVGSAMQALASAQAELEASKSKEVEMLGRLEQVQSDAKELDAKLVNANPASVGVVHPEPIVALQKAKQTTGKAANSAQRAARETDHDSEANESEDDESDDAESDDDDDEDASDESVSKNGKAGPPSKSEFDLDLP
jgi:ribonuclease E